MPRNVLHQVTHHRVNLRLVFPEHPNPRNPIRRKAVPSPAIPDFQRDGMAPSWLDHVADVSPGRLLAVILSHALIYVLFLPVSVSHDDWDWKMAVLATVSYLPIMVRILVTAMLKPRSWMEFLDPFLIAVALPLTSFFLFYTAIRLSENGFFIR